MLPTDTKWIIWLNLRRATRISVSSCPFHANLSSIIIYWVDAKLKEVKRLAFTFEEQTFPLNHLTQVRSTPPQIKHVYLTLTVTIQAHTCGSPPFQIMDVQEAEMPCKGIFSPTDASGVWGKVKFRMFGFILIPHLKPIPVSRFVDLPNTSCDVTHIIDSSSAQSTQWPIPSA